MNIFDGIVVTDIISVFNVASREGRFDTIKDRTSYGLSFCIDGQITYTHNGKEYVSNKSCAVILPKGKSYTLRGDRTGTFPVINFDCIEPLCNTHTIIPIVDVMPFVSDFNLLRTALYPEKDRAKAMSVFYGILHRLTNVMQNLGMLTPAVEYMKNNFESPNISNSLLAEKCGISEVYFRRLFFDKFKITPKQYIITLRLERAKQLLSDGAFNVCETAERCGFTNAYHFSRFFKEKVGVAPGEYMRKNRTYRL